MTVAVFGYIWSQLAYILTILFLRLLLTFSFYWEEIPNTKYQISKHFEVRQTYPATRRYFELSSRCFQNVVKHGFSCLIYYISINRCVLQTR